MGTQKDVGGRGGGGGGHLPESPQPWVSACPLGQRSVTALPTNEEERAFGSSEQHGQPNRIQSTSTKSTTLGSYWHHGGEIHKTVTVYATVMLRE
jgi:hypothetical protein